MLKVESPVKVSVIMPCRDYGRFIRYSLESLRSQSWQDWECVVVDDGSKDDSVQVVAGMAADDVRVRLVNGEGKGPAMARNLGLSAARGEYVQFLDADDFIEPEKLQRQVAFLDENRNIDLVWGDVRFFTDVPGEPLLRKDLSTTVSAPSPDEALLTSMLRRNRIVINSLLVRREAIEEVGGFDSALGAVEDWDLLVRLLLKGRDFHYMPTDETAAIVRSHPASLSHDWRRVLRGIVQMRDKLVPELREPERLVNELMRRDALAGLAIQEARQGQLLKGLGIIWPMALKSRSPRWLIFAVALPFSSLPGLRGVLGKVRRLVLRREPELGG